jgi:uncharacterized protein YegP (UPF0339 family)
MHLEVFSGVAEWYVRLVAANGETMMVSEGYDSKSNAERAAYTVQAEWVATDSIEVRIWE